MKLNILYLVIGFLICFLWLGWSSDKRSDYDRIRQIDKDLISQLKGEHCLYGNPIPVGNEYKMCALRERSFLEKSGIEDIPHTFIRNAEYNCKLWAVKCMAATKNIGFKRALIRGVINRTQYI